MRDRKEELTVQEIAEAAGISPRTVRHYAAAGLFQAPPFRGAATRYGKQHLERLLAIQALRKQNLGLDAIKARFAAEEAVRAETAKVEAAKAAAIEAHATAMHGAPERKAEGATQAYPAEVWERVVLLPGLDLLVNTAGGAILRRLAAEIYAQYGSGARDR